jgi:hypothetical protein
MNAVTRWKTIATIAIAFSAGNLFSTACQNAGGGKANAEDGTTEDGTTEDGTTEDGTPPPASGGAGRAVVAFAYPLDDNGELCFDNRRELGNWYDPSICPCPSGFSAVGINQDSEVVCLED